MTVFLIIISLYGGIEGVPMSSPDACRSAASVINDRVRQSANAYCVSDAPSPKDPSR